MLGFEGNRCTGTVCPAKAQTFLPAFSKFFGPPAPPRWCSARKGKGETCPHLGRPVLRLLYLQE